MAGLYRCSRCARITLDQRGLNTLGIEVAAKRLSFFGRSMAHRLRRASRRTRAFVSISISIVIPAHNSAQHLQKCLAALRASPDSPLEIIVVDDASSDRTREVASAFQVTVLSTEVRRGPAFARNLG